MKSIAIIPCLNCELTIGLVVLDALRYVDDVLVIDDGSEDSSSDIAKSKGAHVLRLEVNRGVGFATQIGMSYATENKYDLLVTLDADGAHNPHDIPILISTHMDSGNILTIGNRWGKGYTLDIPSAKWWANRFASQLVTRIAGIVIPDVACGFRVLSSSIIHCLGKTQDFGFLYETIFCAAKRGKIGYASVDVRYDAEILWVTKQNELLNLLKLCGSWCVDPILAENIQIMESCVVNWQKIIVDLQTDCSSDVLIVHPIRHHGGFMFQRQHFAFRDRYSTTAIVL
jgi:glycosyltransferase involved in cell wall biosynthesis